MRTNFIKIQSHKLGELKLGNIHLIRHLEIMVCFISCKQSVAEDTQAGRWLVSGDLNFGLVSTMPSVAGSLGLNSLHQTPALLWVSGILVNSRQKVLKKCPAPNRHPGLRVSCGLPGRQHFPCAVSAHSHAVPERETLASFLLASVDPINLFFLLILLHVLSL